MARKKAEKGSKAGGKLADNEDGAEGDESEEDDLDVDGLSDVDPEEALERRRAQLAQTTTDSAEQDDFAYEDAEGDSEDIDDDDEGWNEDAGVGEPSSEEEGESSDEEDAAPPPKRRPFRAR